MTEQEQIRAIAELDEIKVAARLTGAGGRWRWLTRDGVAITAEHADQGTTDKDFLIVNSPNYLHSYDAIIPVIQKQDMAYVFCLWDGEGLEEAKMVVPTPSQLCQALLRASGRWYD